MALVRLRKENERKKNANEQYRLKVLTEQEIPPRLSIQPRQYQLMAPIITTTEAYSARKKFKKKRKWHF